MTEQVCTCGVLIEAVIDSPPSPGKFWQRVGTTEVCVDNHWHEPSQPEAAVSEGRNDYQSLYNEKPYAVVSEDKEEPLPNFVSEGLDEGLPHGTHRQAQPQPAGTEPHAFVESEEHNRCDYCGEREGDSIHNEVLKNELKSFRMRVFTAKCREGATDHSTACTIWGDDGLGGTAEGFKEPLPCNCGALINWERGQLESLKARAEQWQRIAAMYHADHKDLSKDGKHWATCKCDICKAYDSLSGPREGEQG